MYKGSSVRLTTDFLSESKEARIQWNDISKELKGKKTNKHSTKNSPSGKTVLQK